MLADVVTFLSCPVCRESLELRRGALACANRHSFDVAREGYVNLLAGGRAPGTADSAEMMAARERFLGSGAFEPIAEAVADAVAAHAPATPGCLVEIGAGTGYYLAHALERTPGRPGIALDISKAAAKRAARAHPRIGSVVCDAWAPLPLRDGCAAAVLDVFAPRNPDEIARVLAPGGVLVVATPTPEHLAELVGVLGLVTVDPEKDARLAAQLGARFEQLTATAVRRTMRLDHDTVLDLVRMGPSARHVDPAELECRVAQLAEPVEATLAVVVGVYGLR